MKHELLCLGEICPIPLLKAQGLIEKLKPGDELMVAVDHSCVTQNLLEHFEKNGLQVTVEEVMNGVWEITIRK